MPAAAFAARKPGKLSVVGSALFNFVIQLVILVGPGKEVPVLGTIAAGRPVETYDDKSTLNFGDFVGQCRNAPLFRGREAENWQHQSLVVGDCHI